MKIDLVVFDLDGTLVSSHETIYKATLHALREVGVTNEIPRHQFMNMIGMHFEDIFREFGFKVPDFEHFLKIYKSIYFDYINESVLFPDVKELIGWLKENDLKIGLLTTKGQDQAELILKHFGLFNNFDGVMGRRPGIAHKPSAEPLIKLCNELDVDIGTTLIVGDSELDINCGKNAGTYTCAVTYGYRSREILERYNPDFLIDRLSSIENILINGTNFQ
ncbi:MAG: HAD family hydrolase [Bacteroidota bacterium]|jgi:HAD superfamily hydrolase (TIGR01549 family)